MEKSPNIILILADDMGYSDIGCYGSEINTPNLDSLANNGLRFSQMYNYARCCPSRAALLTGLHPHQTGVGHMTGNLGIPSHQGYLNENCTTIPEVLKQSGYSTYMSGKWHVGGGYNLLDRNSWEETAGDSAHPIPTQRGFDKFYGTVAGAADYFNPKALMKDDQFIEPDNDNFYMTDAISDNAVSMIEDAASNDSPFFLHVTYTAPHWPLHALEEDIEKYKGSYLKGWDNLRKNRHEELKGLKILEDKWDISPRDASAVAWDNEKHKEWEDLRMSVYSAMVDRMDQGIGRILNKLKDLTIEENTIIMFLSDNGGCAEFLAEDGGAPDKFPYSAPTKDGRATKVGNITSINPGPAGTFMSYDLAWANASNSPFRLFKRWTHEGGISTPFIVYWPKMIKSSEIIHTPTHITDIPATIYDISNSKYPKTFKENEIPPIEGHSFLNIFKTEKWKRPAPLFWEHEGNRAMRQNEWKLVSEVGSGWELYNMSEDRTELHNLAHTEKDRVKMMIKKYTDWSNSHHVELWPIPPHTWNPSMRAPHAHDLSSYYSSSYFHKYDDK